VCTEVETRLYVGGLLSPYRLSCSNNQSMDEIFVYLGRQGQMPYRRVRERPSRLCRGTHAMPLALYAALAHINKGARLFLAFCDLTPSPMDQSGEFSFSCRYTDKKENQISSYVGKLRLEQSQSHI
jgi:hypothetical protein